MKSIATIAALLLAAAAAMAAEPAPPINIIFSADNASCAAWTKSAGNKLIRQQYEMWARGFVSGHNYANPAQQVKVGAFPGGDDLYKYFDQYCRDNPQHTVVAAAIQLVEQLAAPAPAAKPAPARKQPAKAPASVPAK
ncbi:MAG: hypothetical protein K8S22_21100 [Betaproteobacteria bacterium]|nr:hypothetical protein [Betaproteobacteria bacterium]